jgi:hypothetical protein
MVVVGVVGFGDANIRACRESETKVTDDDDDDTLLPFRKTNVNENVVPAMNDTIATIDIIIAPTQIGFSSSIGIVRNVLLLLCCRSREDTLDLWSCMLYSRTFKTTSILNCLFINRNSRGTNDLSYLLPKIGDGVAKWYLPIGLMMALVTAEQLLLC